jgi:6-phosphogluconolactonase/glucosamine-6-phosphate isomerase/deaminase
MSEYHFTDIKQLVTSLYVEIEAFISRGGRKKINICVSGGASITPILRRLFWQFPEIIYHVHLYLTDERLGVPLQLTNLNTLKESLPEGAHIYSPCDTPTLSEMWDLSLLGFGIDGHLASIFSAEVVSSNDLQTSEVRGYFVTSEPIGDPLCVRISMNLQQLLFSRKIFVCLNAMEKEAILMKSKDGGATVLAQLLHYARDRVFLCKVIS